MKVWLVEWGAGGAHAEARMPDKYAAILPADTPVDRVREIVELLYANASYTRSERLHLAQGTWNNPYRAQYDSGIVSCGENPYLTARLVDADTIPVDEEDH